MPKQSLFLSVFAVCFENFLNHQLSASGENTLVNISQNNYEVPTFIPLLKEALM